MKVENMTSANGNPVPNQFIIWNDGECFFQSYKTIIACISKGKTILDKFFWDYSVTTGKYRNMFLGESKAETLKKIESGEYILMNLNTGTE